MTSSNARGTAPTADPGGSQQSAASLREYERAVALYISAGGEETVQRVVTAISRITRGFDVHYRRQFAEQGLTHGEWTVLAALAQEGPDASLTPGRLAEIGAVSPSTMTHRLGRMSERGLLVRSEDAGNRTRVQVALTRTGWELFRDGVIEADAIEARALSVLTAQERTQLAAMLERVMAQVP
ncbi:MarR family winged helix-turn-helix transcriptional regulator [Nocardioides sp. Iso805N]|uniref:MarR family winged helix-turn-helix transcriptional regulator n=1 Tax=Nocardioides sp. Iso805N TaxID=1283287 RepID=UPI0018DEE131|nr:MarR family winged helix-turn-helix transcriptional regulator [Nocardioides sp. Iso805N]